VCGQDGQSPRMAHPEVLGVHVQLLTVQLGQLGVGCFEIFQVLHSFPKGAEHFLAMGADLGVTDDGSGAGQVPEAIKEPLGPGVDDQQPAERWGDTSTHTPLAFPPMPAAVSPCTYRPLHTPLPCSAGPSIARRQPLASHTLWPCTR
uniref:Uncharacterized protein n=1 Tax=Anser brachyrhynchus TaxID=132585 RepID=A0A8B9I747_9AVES